MQQRGLTLIEMAVTLAVMALLLFAAAPNIGAWIDNTRIRNAADSLQSGLQLARGEAVRRNQSVTFWLVSSDDPSKLDNSCALSNTSGSWVVSLLSPAGNCGATDPDAAPMIVTGRPVGDGGGSVAITAVQSDGSTAATQITFNGFGRIANTADAINRINVTGTRDDVEYRHLRLEVSSAGLVRMCDPRVTNDTDPRLCKFSNAE